MWNLRYSEVSTRDVKAGLRGIDVLVMPDGYAFYALEALGRDGKEALKKWIRSGGRIVTWQGGIRVLVRSGISTVKWGRTNAAAPGSLIRTTVDQSSPLAKGIGPTMWVMYTSDGIVRAAMPSCDSPAPTAPTSRPPERPSGLSMLTSASVVSDEAVGKGRVVSFWIDPNFRAWTLGTERMLWNAITGPDPRRAAARTAVPDRVAAVAAAKGAERRHRDVGDAIRVAVPRDQASAAQRIIGSLGLKAFQSPLRNERRLIVVPNVEYLGLEESRQLAQVLPRLKRSGVTVLWASLPGP